MRDKIVSTSRTAFWATIAGLLLLTGAGCATTETETAKSNRVNPIVEQAWAHGHTPWRYKYRQGRSMRPRYVGQKPAFPCKLCDGNAVAATEEVDDQ